MDESKTQQKNSFRRIAGLSIPANKRTIIALCYITGIGLHTSKEICKAVGIDESKRFYLLTEEEIQKITDTIKKNNIVIGDDVKKIRLSNIHRKITMRSYQGIRHQKNQKVRGQRNRNTGQHSKKKARVL